MPLTRKPTKNPNAIAMLIEDHQRVQKLFREFAKADDPGARHQIALRVCAELKVHTTLEEEIFYPAARSVLDPDLMYEAEVEHRCAKDLIAALERLAPEDPAYVGTFTVLAAYVQHHVREEQEELFPKLRNKDLDLHALAADMRARKHRLKMSIGSAVAPVETAPQPRPRLANRVNRPVLTAPRKIG